MSLHWPPTAELLAGSVVADDRNVGRVRRDTSERRCQQPDAGCAATLNGCERMQRQSQSDLVKHAAEPS